MLDRDVLLALLLYVGVLGLATEAIYELLKVFFEPKKRKDPETLRDNLIPPVIGLLLVLAFLPRTFFTDLPIQPRLMILSIAFTVVLVSRTSNIRHSGGKALGELVGSIIDRIFPR